MIRDPYNSITTVRKARWDEEDHRRWLCDLCGRDYKGSRALSEHRVLCIAEYKKAISK